MKIGGIIGFIGGILGLIAPFLGSTLQATLTGGAGAMGWVLAIVSLIVLIFGLVLAAEKLLKASTAIVLILGIIELILGAATMGTLGMALLAVLGGIIAIIGAAVAILVEGAFA